MSTQGRDHPTEEALTEFALGVNQEALAEHVASCPECGAYVKEIAAVKQSVKALPDEEAPEELRSRILRRAPRKQGGPMAWFSLSRGPWGVTLLALGVAAAAIFLYVLFAYVL